jgi:hypothetical protein
LIESPCAVLTGGCGEIAGILLQRKPTIRITRSTEAFIRLDELWSKDDQRTENLLHAGNRIDKAQEVFEQRVRHRRDGAIPSVKVSAF